MTEVSGDGRQGVSKKDRCESRQRDVNSVRSSVAGSRSPSANAIPSGIGAGADFPFGDHDRTEKDRDEKSGTPFAKAAKGRPPARYLQGIGLFKGCC